MKEKRYSISEASRLLEVENHVLRYWEEELELNIPRNELGHRYYREEEIQLLNCIKELKKKGFQLKAVKEVLPDLEQKKLIDVHKLLATQVELESLGITEQEEGEQPRSHTDGDMRAEEEDRPHGRSGRMTAPGEESDSGEPEEEENTGAETGGKMAGGKIISMRKPEESLQMPPAQRETQTVSIRDNEEKMREFESIMGRIIGKALAEQAENLSDVIGDRISNRVIREVDDVMEEREEREEARFKKLDEAIRSHQKARQEIAAAKDEGGRRKSRFFRKNKRKI